MKIAALTGDALEAALPAVADLRIRVFREWPYLYDGDVTYEARYLNAYRDNPRSILVGAFDGDTLVGASTGTPLADHSNEFAEAFSGSDLDVDKFFYCAESVLLPGYRGLGIGHQFFDLREAHARRCGFTACCFCAVIRPNDHPQNPQSYRPLDPFWRRRGYLPLEGVIAEFSWKDLEEPRESLKPLQVWGRFF
ncbi:MAG: GNAT family N-acetyltransferase [Pseudomonadota bacterium]